MIHKSNRKKEKSVTKTLKVRKVYHKKFVDWNSSNQHWRRGVWFEYFLFLIFFCFKKDSECFSMKFLFWFYFLAVFLVAAFLGAFLEAVFLAPPFLATFLVVVFLATFLVAFLETLGLAEPVFLAIVCLFCFLMKLDSRVERDRKFERENWIVEIRRSFNKVF